MKSIIYHLLIALMASTGFVIPATTQQARAQQQKSDKQSRTGTITGTVVDAESGDALIGVSVLIKGTRNGAATDVDGQFRISGVKPGNYTLRFTTVTHATYLVENVKVKPGKTTTVDIAMKSKTHNLGKVAVTARALENTEAALLNQRQKSIGLSNAISAETISSSAAGNAAEALKKVTGATVVEGKYVYVRGLGNRYTETQLNGANLPSADPNRKSFQMDLFPSSMIKNITTVKTFTPDRPGNFTGGLVNVETKDFPDDFTFEFSASRSFNTQTSFESVLQGNSSPTDFLGFDGGARQMPENVESYLKHNENFPRRYNNIDAHLDKAQKLAELSRSFGGLMAPTKESIGMNQSYSISVGNLLKVAGNDLGYTASLNYSRSFSGYTNGRKARWAGSPGADSLFPRMNLHDNKGTKNVELGGMLDVSYRFDPNNKISATYMRTQYGTSTARYLHGTSTKDLSARATLQTRTIHYIERSLSSLQMEGKHHLPNLGKTTINWDATYAKNTQNEPDLRYFWNVRTYLPAFNDSVYSIPMNNLSTPPSRYFRNLDERTFNASVNVTVPFPTHASTRGKFKFGGSYNNVERTFREQRVEYKMPETGTIDLNAVGGNVNEFFNHAGLLDTKNGKAYGLTIENATTLRNNYNAYKDIYAAYGMVEFPIFDRLRFAGGVRMEKSDIATISLDTTVAEGHLENTDFLPSLNLTYNITDKMNARLSVTRTLARPSFRELAPYVTFNFVGDYLFTGNADLKRTLITNYDVRWEWFPNPGEIISVSGFYKEFKNPLERVIRIDIGNNAASIRNVDRGIVYGAEFEIRKNLDFLGGFMRHFMISTNFTLVESRVNVPRLELVEILNLKTQQMSKKEIDRAISKAPEKVKYRPLSNQSPYVFNFDISYRNPALGLTADVYYHVFGDRLTQVMRGSTPNSFQRSYGTLNFVASKSIGRGFTLNASVENILNPEIRETQKFKGVHYVNQAYKKGITYKIGIKYQF